MLGLVFIIVVGVLVSIFLLKDTFIFSKFEKVGVVIISFSMSFVFYSFIAILLVMITGYTVNEESEILIGDSSKYEVITSEFSIDSVFLDKYFVADFLFNKSSIDFEKIVE